MAYLEVLLNGSLLTRAGSRGISVLSVGVILGTRGGAFLNVSGMSVSDGQRTYSHWPSKSLHGRDELQITLLADGEATTPSSTVVEPVLPLGEELARLPQRVEANGVVAALDTGPAKSYSFTRAPRSGVLEIAAASGTTVRAFSEGEEQLQAEVLFSAGACKLEVHALKTEPDGTTTGRQWLCEPLEFGESVRVAYVP